MQIIDHFTSTLHEVVTYIAHSIFITTAIASLHVRIIMHITVTVSTCAKLIDLMFTAIKVLFTLLQT